MDPIMNSQPIEVIDTNGFNKFKYPAIVHNGYLYHFHKKCKRHLRWRCCRRLSWKCPAVLRMTRGMSEIAHITVDHEHIHANDLDAIEAFKNVINKHKQSSLSSKNKCFKPKDLNKFFLTNSKDTIFNFENNPLNKLEQKNNKNQLKNVNQICRATLPNEHNMTINNNKNKNKFSLRNNINKRNYILSKNNQIEKNALIRRRKKNVYMPIANTRTFKRSLTTNTNKRKNIKTTNKQKIKSTLITNACSQTIPSKVKPRKNTSKFTNKNLPINTTTSTSTPVLKSISTIGSLPSIKVPFNMIESHLNKNIDNENESISDSDDNNDDDDDDSIFGSDGVNYNTVINDNDDEENNIKFVQDDCMSNNYNKENWPTILKKLSDPSTGIKVLEGILLRKALIQMMQGNNIKFVQDDCMSNNYNKENWPTILKKLSDPSTGIKVLEGILLRKALIQMMQGNNRTNREVLILKHYSCSIDNLKHKYDRLLQKVKTLKNSLKSDRNMRRTSVLNKKAKQFDNNTEYHNVDSLNRVQVNDEAKIDGEDEKHNRPTRTRRQPARLSIYHLYSDSD
ncbi:putative uncharacterized protein DDB_G0282133 isoform X1 [Aphis gossypii]|uniref:putative uncharacterized protein DDB_G0282133 isoform X1 n=1 Tax=Aphis gossypii TaxID=80765 RepID=UPI00215941F3|nr:putative uncharacterized protein DDB_G0282133 isoform X1 [Aphis gossypii]